MRILTCTGFGGTGSSAITDLLKEFNNVYSYGDFEFRFIQDPNGIRDLEYALVENNDRLSTDYYIKQYKENIKRLSKNKINNYEKIFNSKFLVYSNKYIDSLIDNTWSGFWHKDIENFNYFKKFIYYSERTFQKYFLKKKEGGAEIFNKLFKIKMYYSNPKEKFYIETQKYLKDLFQELLKDQNKKVLALDQLVPATNIKKYLNYFEDLKVVVVDRDPRDLYLLNIKYWKEEWIPKDIEVFISWYKNIRENDSYGKNNENILYINFEDLIYNYEITLAKLVTFWGIEKENHIHKKVFFNPDVSKKNTKLYLTEENLSKEIEKISKELQKYLYI